MLHRKIRASIDALAADPDLGKPLIGVLAGRWSLRVGSLRIIYERAPRTVRILMVGPREAVYLEAALLRRRKTGKRSTTVR